MSHLDKAIKFLIENKGYLKKSPYVLGERLNINDIDICKVALRNVKDSLKYSSLSLIDKTKNLQKKYNETLHKLNNTIEKSKPKVLIYDIETSYNIVKSWRVGYNLNINPSNIIHERKIICVSYKWLGEEDIYNLQWDINQDDKFLLEQFIEVLNDADLIVAHNGDRYDLKFIKTRAIKHELEMLIDYPQFDTLKVAKKKFSFNSNKLDYISEYLGFENKIKTSMSLWDDIIFKKCQTAMDKMVDYCNKDVELLEKVYNKLVYWEKPKLHVGVLLNQNKISSPISGSMNLQLLKTVTTTGGTIKRVMKDLDTNRIFEMSNVNYLKYTENK